MMLLENRIDEVMEVLENFNHVVYQSYEWLILKDYYSKLIDDGRCNNWGLFSFVTNAAFSIKCFSSFEEALEANGGYSESDILLQHNNAVLMNYSPKL